MRLAAFLTLTVAIPVSKTTVRFGNSPERLIELTKINPVRQLIGQSLEGPKGRASGCHVYAVTGSLCSPSQICDSAEHCQPEKVT